MNLYTQIARSHLGSSILFGSSFVALAASDGAAAAASAGALAAAAWFGSFPLIRRLAGARHGA